MLGKCASFIPCTLIALSTAQASIVFTDDFSYPDGPLVVVSNGRWKTHSGTGGQVEVGRGQITLSQKRSEDVSAVFLEGAVIGATNSAALYASFKINFTTLPSGPNGSYFAHFKDASATTGFRCRVFATTNGAALGSYRLGIAAAANTASVVLAQDLMLNAAYTVVYRMNLSNNVSTLWLNPNAETDWHVTSSDSAVPKTVVGFALRESLASGAGMGELTLDDLIIATTFAELGVVARPRIRVQPHNATVFEGSDVNLDVTADGPAPLKYQWLFNGTELAGATGAELVLKDVRLENAGQYQVVVSDATSSIVSGPAYLTVEPRLAPISISLQPGAGVLLCWPAAPDQTYSVWATDSVSAEFTLLGAGLSFPDGNGLFADDPGGAPMRFYRLCTP